MRRDSQRSWRKFGYLSFLISLCDFDFLGDVGREEEGGRGKAGWRGGLGGVGWGRVGGRVRWGWVERAGMRAGRRRAQVETGLGKQRAGGEGAQGEGTMAGEVGWGVGGGRRGISVAEAISASQERLSPCQV